MAIVATVILGIHFEDFVGLELIILKRFQPCAAASLSYYYHHLFLR